ncbi:hypothetical protein [Mucilaginibacter ginsenosidivorax]|uniref:Uncharacterized protein n=1 Tax=Mucilaginibacter ginsenosidivorax TaxID=862126 RepID=A0A5B8WC53_9SPHI|nr:hypothetical protein [Mucilaginibacter ginsenosidivorax]QEC79618.1 hypothetical protein FSB76_28045 [Mucilaginibacter ginsenosidivorax]
MPFISVNVEKSIRYKILIPQVSLINFFRYFLAWCLGLALIFVSIGVNLNPKNHYSLFSTLVFYSFALFFTLNLVLLNNLTHLKGFSEDANRADITAVLEEYFGNAIPLATGRISRNVKAPKGLNSGRIVTVIFDRENVYINVTSIVGSRNIISPYHGLYNYIKCKRIARDFKRR